MARASPVPQKVTKKTVTDFGDIASSVLTDRQIGKARTIIDSVLMEMARIMREGTPQDKLKLTTSVLPHLFKQESDINTGVDEMRDELDTLYRDLGLKQ